MMSNLDNEPILLYDGDCGLCSFAVQFILRHEKDKRLKFARLQSGFAEDMLLNYRNLPADLDSVVLLQNKSVYIKSRALTRLTPYLKFPFNLLAVFKVIPTAIADRMYDWMARNRQRFFKQQCLLPSKEQTNRFVG